MPRSGIPSPDEFFVCSIQLVSAIHYSVLIYFPKAVHIYFPLSKAIHAFVSRLFGSIFLCLNITRLQSAYFPTILHVSMLNANFTSGLQDDVKVSRTQKGFDFSVLCILYRTAACMRSPVTEDFIFVSD